MLTPAEKVAFLLALGLSLALTAYGVLRIVRIVRRGPGRLNEEILGRIPGVAATYFGQPTVLKARFWPSLAHVFVVWGFSYYLLVNVGDTFDAFVPGGRFLGGGAVGNVYRLLGDLLTIGVLVGMVALVLRRLIFGREIFGFLPATPVLPGVRVGMARDSMIVAGFILLHVGWRFLGQTLRLAREPAFDRWQPFASGAAAVWTGAPPEFVRTMEHVAFWLAIGLILAFLPYFPYTKHLHLFLAPVNFLTKPTRRSMGALDPIDFDKESATYGAARIEDLSRTQLVDAYACIQCNRCQDVCPAHATGKALSPSALEINKRYLLNREGARLAAGGPSTARLIEATISEEALWACTACGACIEICPVGNEPMRDILDIRRNQVLAEAVFPDELQTAYRGMERPANPWGIGPEQRLDWCRDLDVPTIDQHPHPEVLWWVGCAPATEPRAQRTARDVVRILKAAGVDFAVLGARERCNGDPARRSGNEYLFAELARQNVETLNAVGATRILTTCPHCFHVLGNEYPDFGGRYQVLHHTELIAELLQSGRLALARGMLADVAFHDPCYLGRQNGVYEAPRASLAAAGATLRELPQSRNRSFCCGAGGAQMWKEEEPGRMRVSTERFRQVRESGAKTLAVGCPFCMIMLSDASAAAESAISVRDVAQIVAAALE